VLINIRDFQFSRHLLQALTKPCRIYSVCKIECINMDNMDNSVTLPDCALWLGNRGHVYAGQE
jgi:hypothetical protein